MKKPVVRVMQDPYDEVGTGRYVEAKCFNATCLICYRERIFIGFAFLIPIPLPCPACKGKGTVRKLIGSKK